MYRARRCMRQQCPIRLNMLPRNAILFFNSAHGVMILCVPHQASSSMLALRTSLSHLICVSSASQRRINTMPSQFPKSRSAYSWSIVRVCPQYWKAVILAPLSYSISCISFRSRRGRASIRQSGSKRHLLVCLCLGRFDTGEIFLRGLLGWCVLHQFDVRNSLILSPHHDVAGDFLPGKLA